MTTLADTFTSILSLVQLALLFGIIRYLFKAFSGEVTGYGERHPERGVSSVGNWLKNKFKKEEKEEEKAEEQEKQIEKNEALIERFNHIEVILNKMEEQQFEHELVEIENLIQVLQHLIEIAQNGADLSPYHNQLKQIQTRISDLLKRMANAERLVERQTNLLTQEIKLFRDEIGRLAQVRSSLNMIKGLSSEINKAIEKHAKGEYGKNKVYYKTLQDENNAKRIAEIAKEIDEIVAKSDSMFKHMKEIADRDYRLSQELKQMIEGGMKELEGIDVSTIYHDRLGLSSGDIQGVVQQLNIILGKFKLARDEEGKMRLIIGSQLEAEAKVQALLQEEKKMITAVNKLLEEIRKISGKTQVDFKIPS